MRTPTPHVVTKARLTADKALMAIRSWRHVYVMNCLRAFLKLPRTSVTRMKFCLIVAQKAKDAGLYAKSTYLRDVAYSFIKRFYEFSSPRIVNRYKSYEHWNHWKQRECVDFDLLTPKGQRRAGIKIA